MTREEQTNLVRQAIEQIADDRDQLLEAECKLDTDLNPRLETLPAEAAPGVAKLDLLLSSLREWLGELTL
jgi:hypothetical protein